MARTKRSSRKIGPKTESARPKPAKARKKIPKKDLDAEEEEDLLDDDIVYEDSQDFTTDSGGQSIWSNQMITNAVHEFVRRNPKMGHVKMIEHFCEWVNRFINRPNKHNGYARWASKIRQAFNGCGNWTLGKDACTALNRWSKRQAKAMAARKLYEPHQAERFQMGDMMELWLHFLKSHKRVKREAALYSAMTFFTGARAIEIGNLWIEDLRFSQNGSALVMPIRESKTNVFKNVPERLTMVFIDECPIDFKALYLEIKGERVSGRL